MIDFELETSILDQLKGVLPLVSGCDNESGEAAGEEKRSAHSYRYDFGNPGLLHGDSIKNLGGLHRPLIVGNDRELREAAHLFDHLVEAVQVGVVQRSIDFVEE